jgi:S-adenosylmethionine/arginine decarboxylase-like enzyme
VHRNPRVRHHPRAEHESSDDTILDHAYSHLTAEFHGVPAEQLRDAALLGGLLIAAASAVGFSTIGVPSVRHQADDGVSAVLLLDGGHMLLHALAAACASRSTNAAVRCCRAGFA